MLKSLRHATGLLALLFAVVSNAHAATIFLSGDVSIITSLDGSFGDTVNPGNQVFFQNILGSGTRVVLDDRTAAGWSPVLDTINNYYNGLGGVSSSTLSGPLTSAALSGANLFISVMPATDYSPEELTVLASFGGDILFIGDNADYPLTTARLNAALSGLGSSMSLLGITIDPNGPRVARGLQIATDPYTSGITSLHYHAPGQISVGTGKALFFGRGGQPFIGYEVVSAPEPVSVLLIGLGLGGLCIARRKLQV